MIARITSASLYESAGRHLGYATENEESAAKLLDAGFGAEAEHFFKAAHAYSAQARKFARRARLIAQIETAMKRDER